MLGSIGWPEVILILVVVVLIFGVGRITKLGGELGSGIRAFKESLNGEKKKPDTSADKPEEKENQDIPKPG